MALKNNWIYLLLLVSVLSAVGALITGNFIFKSGTAGMGILILLLLFFTKEKPDRTSFWIMTAFLFSIAGDWFLSHMKGNAAMFTEGIALFFLAHVGYLMYALRNGRIRWGFTGIVLAVFLVFYVLVLYPDIHDSVLVTAVLIYLLISCFSLGAAAGIRDKGLVKGAYVFGIFLILFSDTIISLKEFVGYESLNFLILPTYYLAHISITYALIRKALAGR
ncbi:MAG: lysoplasmalogenase [Bacteroidales bacterium]|nr:lysoplasmalogenase [Bacteroidales bacterium]